MQNADQVANSLRDALLSAVAEGGCRYLSERTRAQITAALALAREARAAARRPYASGASC